MRTSKNISIIFIFVLAAQSALGKDIQKPLALVADQVISMDYFKTSLISNRTSGDLSKLADSMTKEGKQALLNDLVDIKLITMKAREEGLDSLPQVKAQLELAADSILVQEYLKRQVEKLDLSDAGLRAYYGQHPDEFRTEKKVKALHVITASLDEANKAREAILAGREFRDVAAEVNIDSTKTLRGDLGWTKRGIFVKEFEEVLFNMKVGEISNAVKTSFGYHIIKVEEIDEGQVRPFESVRDAVQKTIARNTISGLKQELRKKHSITIDRKLLEAGDL
ncbi:peptidylprolyl isomerase [Geobacter argillaceus]|uniref:Peptidyl-prolyl cis-trans isomerase C n=1 Tax=Geobacter argillaceus TaxID=345631 RepID=A0A562WR29_9BACT|nr:peptidyl-prolyl cis-trans isomerase [Geobacter argillaceus]TWJ32799.1 peptidyl-prolyl cis-trans isomerase C [Geobacter argillaceus]